MQEKTEGYFDEGKSGFVEIALVDGNLILNLSALRAVRLVEDAYRPASEDLPGFGDERSDMLLIYTDGHRASLTMQTSPTFPDKEEMTDIPEDELTSYQYFDIVMSLTHSAPFVLLGDCDGDCSSALFVQCDQIAALVVSNSLIYKGWSDRFLEIHDAEEADRVDTRLSQDKLSDRDASDVDAGSEV